MGATCYQAILQPCHLTSFGRSWNGLAAADSSSLCEAAHDWCWVRTYPCATCGSPGLSPCGHDVAGSPLGHCVPLPQGNGRPSGANSPLSWVTGFQEYAEADSVQAVASGPSRGLCEHCSSTLSSPYPVCREDGSGESWEGGAFGGHPQCAGLEFSRLQLLPEM